MPMQIKSKTEALGASLDEDRRGAVQGPAGSRRPGRARAAAGSGGAAGGRRRPGGDDKVVDADFEEVDDQKKRGSA